MMCRDRKEYLPKIVDVLTQLLQTDEETEVTVIHSAIMSLLRKNCKGKLTCKIAALSSYITLSITFRYIDRLVLSSEDRR